MSSSPVPLFARIEWRGPPPANSQRQRLWEELQAWLAKSQAASHPVDGDRHLILGNLEAREADAALFPMADGVKIFVGLIHGARPESGQLLSTFEAGQISFYLEENLSIAKWEEALRDLLLS